MSSESYPFEPEKTILLKDHVEILKRRGIPTMPKSFLITQLMLAIAILILAAAQIIPYLNIICSDVVVTRLR